MIVLGLDTATPDAVVAVCDGGDPLAQRRIGPGPERPRHGSALLGAIEECVAEAGGWKRIARIAVGIGPGTFTGLRIGVVTARGLAAARGLDLVPVSSLDALAAGVLAAAPGPGCAAVIDARRAEVFAALYSSGGERTTGPAVLSPEALAVMGDPSQPLPACGDGAVRFRGEIAAQGGFEIPADDDPRHGIDGRRVCEIGAAGDPVPLHEVLPAYLREPDAKRWLARDNPANRSR